MNYQYDIYDFELAFGHIYYAAIRSGRTADTDK